MSKEEILQEMLDDVSNNYDKRVGSFIYDSLAPVAKQLAKTDDYAKEVKKKLSIENLTGDELAQRIRERTGIQRRPATKAVGSVTLTGTGTIRTGDVFETQNGIRFVATETKEIVVSGTVSIEAVNAGSRGMVAADTITLFPVTLAGFTDVNNPEPTRDGFDAESDDDLLQRYYVHIQTPATSGNISHYLLWASEIAGVGDARVFPLWNGDNTVKVIIIDSNRQPASPELVDSVQEYIDPSTTGMGLGTAPIGAFVTIASAEGVDINIGVSVTVAQGYTEQEVEDNITANITQYLATVAFKESIISYARLGAAILNSEGVGDYTNLTVNGDTSNIAINDDEVAVVGSVTVNVT